MFVSTTSGHQGPPIPSTHHLLLPHVPCLRPLLIILLPWQTLKCVCGIPGGVVTQADLGTPHLPVYWAVFTMSWATNQSLYKIRTERGGCMAVPSGPRRLTGVDTITMSISSCASGDTIHTHTLWVHVSPTSHRGPEHFDGFPVGR